MASLGSGSEVQTILLLSAFTLPDSTIELRLRSKSVGRSTWPLCTAISLAAVVAPSLYFQNVFGSIFQTSLEYQVGISQPEVEPTSANEIARPLVSSGNFATFRSGFPITIAW